MNVGEGPGVGAETTQEKHTLSRIRTNTFKNSSHAYIRALDQQQPPEQREVCGSERERGR